MHFSPRPAAVDASRPPVCPDVRVHRRVVVAARAIGRNAAVRAAIGPFVTTRAAVLLAGYLAVAIFGYPSDDVPFRVSFNELENLPARWDTEWYLKIARDGYTWNGDPYDMQPVVFFPALPALMRGGALVTGTLVHGGLLAALLCFLGALIYLYRLAEPLVGSRAAANALWLLASYPFAVYYSAPYTESLYLLASIAAFVHLSRTEWRASAGWGLFAGLCRPNGFLIAAPLALIAARRTVASRSIRVGDWLPAVAPLAGPLLFSAYLYWTFGDPTAWVKGQAAWGRQYVGVWASLRDLFVDRYAVIAGVGLYRYTFEQPFDFLHSMAALFALVSIWPVWRRLGAPYAVLVAANLLPPLVSGGTMSIGRMTSVLFPSFVGLAAIVPERYVSALITTGCVLQGVIAAAFFTWRDAY
jgi:hypothetical protein